jgi:hypothetical protein
LLINLDKVYQKKIWLSSWDESETSYKE